MALLVEQTGWALMHVHYWTLAFCNEASLAAVANPCPSMPKVRERKREPFPLHAAFTLHAHGSSNFGPSAVAVGSLMRGPDPKH